MKIKACSNLHVTQQERKCAVHYFKEMCFNSEKSQTMCVEYKKKNQKEKSK